MYAEVIRDKNNNLTYRTLAGAASDGFPLGTIVAMYTTSVPTGFLPCTGVEFDIEQYPALYVLLGSNKTPDLREAALRGIGLSTREAIQTHDVYTLGQFKDDAIALNTTGIITNGSADIANSGLVMGKATGPAMSAVTRGKSVGVNYIIKATVGSIAVGDPDVYNQVVVFLEDNYIKGTHFTNGALLKYDADSNEFTELPIPDKSNSFLSADVEFTSDWSFNGKKYDKDLNQIVNPNEPSTQVMIGKMTANFKAKKDIAYHSYYCYKGLSDLGDPDYYYFKSDMDEIAPPDDEHLLNEEVVCQAVLYNGYIYIKKDSSWFKPSRFNDDLPVLGDAITDATVLAALNAATPYDFCLQHYVVWDSFLVRELNPTGFTVGMALTPDYVTPDSDYLPVYYNVYYGTDFEYTWKSNGSGKGIAFIGTRAQYEIAKRIAEGQEGHIPSGALVIITDEKSTLIGEDQ